LLRFKNNVLVNVLEWVEREANADRSGMRVSSFLSASTSKREGEKSGEGFSLLQ